MGLAVISLTHHPVIKVYSLFISAARSRVNHSVTLNEWSGIKLVYTLGSIFRDSIVHSFLILYRRKAADVT